MLSGGACVVLFVIICVRASSVHQRDKELVEQEPTFYDDYHPERTAKSDEVREKTDFEKHTFYSEYGEEKQKTRDRPIVITLMRQDKSQKNISSANNNDEDYYYINGDDYEKLDQMGDEEYDEMYDDYENQESSNDNSFEEYDNPYRRQESGQYHYTYQAQPAMRTRHRTKNNFYHPPGDKYSSNVVGYSIKVKHPTLPTNQYSNEEPPFNEKFRPEKTKGFEKQIKYFDGSLNTADKLKKLQIKFNNGFTENQDNIFAQLTNFKGHHNPSSFNVGSKFRDLQVQFNNEFTKNQGILNQFTNLKSHQSPSSDVTNHYYSIPNQQFPTVDTTEGIDHFQYSPQYVLQPQYEASDLKSFSSDSPEFIAFINSLKSNNFEQSSDIKTQHDFKSHEQNHQISEVSTDEVPMIFRYADNSQSNLYDLENQATSGDSKFEEDSIGNFKDKEKIKTITFTENVPFPVKVEKQVPVPIKIPVDKPYPIYISKPVPVRVHKPVPVPIKVPVPKPYPVQKIVPYPVKIQVPRSFPVPVNKPYPVYFFKKVPYAVIKPRFYPVKVPVEKPVPYAVTYNKYVPVPVYKDVPVPVKIPFQENIKVDVEYEKPIAKSTEEIKAYATNYNYTHINNEVKLPIHIPLDKVKDSFYYDDDDDDDDNANYDDKMFDKETLALYSMNRFPEKSKLTINKHKEPNDDLYNGNKMHEKDTVSYFNFDHYPNKDKITYSYKNEEQSVNDDATAKQEKIHDQEAIAFFNFNHFPKNPKPTYAYENNGNSNNDGMTTAIFNLDHYPEKQNTKFSEEVGEYSSNNEQVYNKKTKAHFSMDLYPEKEKSTFPKQVEEHTFKEEPGYYQKNKAYPSDIRDSKQFYVVKDYTSRERLRDSEKDKAEGNSDSDIQENDSKSHSEEDGKHALHYHDILRVKSLRPSLHKIKISKIRSHKKSNKKSHNKLRHANENGRNLTLVDSQSSPSSLKTTKVSSVGSVWRGSKRYTPSQDSYDQNYDSSKYDWSSEESPAYKSNSERNGFGEKEMSEKISREIKTNDFKEENGPGNEHSTQSSVTPSTTTRQAWSTNHNRRRNRHAHREPSRENSTLTSR